jgi:hypothetical protein
MLNGRYCASCGQDSRHPPDRLAPLAAYVFSQATGLEHSVPRSFLYLLFRPGRLTKDFVEGRRARYVSPVQLYLWCTAMFFVVHAYSPFVRLDRRTGAIVSSLSAVAIGTSLPATMIQRLASRGVSLDAFGARFDLAVSAYLPVLLVGLVVACVALLAIQLRRETALTHATFALHWTAFYFVLESVRKLLPLPRAWEVPASMAAALVAVVYLAVALRVVYRRSGPGSIARALVFYVVFAALLGGWLWSTTLVAEHLA